LAVGLEPGGGIVKIRGLGVPPMNSTHMGETPKPLLKALGQLEMEIQQGMKELEGMLKSGK
jgi:hypothetical protein